MTKKPKVELINDWGECQRAIECLADRLSHATYFGCWEQPGEHISPNAARAIQTLTELVPRLIKAYEDLYEHSMNMLTAWEAYMNSQTPAGLHLPTTNASRKPGEALYRAK